MPAIETHDLTKRYGDVLAVDALDLTIPSGSVYGFLGPNGAGKTTTMRMLTTLTRPTSGSATVAGNPVEDRRAVVERIGYLPEGPPLFDELTGHEQLAYVAGLRDLPDQHVDDRIDEYASALDLEADLGRRIDGYSKGMRQKLAFVQVLLHDPDVLFLDEPVSGLDPRAARTLRNTIDDLADGGTTIFLSSHVLPVVEEHADEVGVLSNGRLVAEGPPGDLRSRADSDAERSLEDVFLELTAEAPGGTTRGSATVESTDGASPGGATPERLRDDASAEPADAAAVHPDDASTKPADESVAESTAGGEESDE